MIEIATIQVLMLHATFHFKFLDEMTMPVKAGFKGGQGSLPTALLSSLLQCPVDLPQAQVPPSEVWRQPRAMRAASRWFGNMALVACSAVIQKAVQHGPSLGKSAALKLGMLDLPGGESGTASPFKRPR